MSFSYSINAGKLLYGGNTDNQNYLKGTYGFSDNALAGIDTGSFTNPGKMVAEYSAIFDSTLAVSDAYKFFENENTQSMQTLLTKNEISYTSNTAISRTAAYTEMFLENFKTSAASSKIDITSGSFDFNGYTFATLDANGLPTGSNITINSSNPITNLNKAQIESLAYKLETEANLLKSEMAIKDLKYGGYPAVGYTAADAKVKVLQQQLDAQMQQFLKCYDQLFAQYKIDAGAHYYDNDEVDYKIREQEAATAATMAAQMAMDYATKYYSQNIKPTVNDYVFGQAPIMFTTLDNTGKTIGKDGTIQNIELINELENYNSLSSSDLYGLFAYGKDDNKYLIKNRATNETATEANYEKMFWDMNKGLNRADGTLTTGFMSGDLNGSDQTGWINGTKITGAGGDKIIDEISGTKSAMSAYINWIVRDSFGVGGFTTTIRNTDYCSDKADFAATEIFSAAQKLVDLKMQLEKASIEAAINNQVNAEYEARLGALNALKSLKYCLGSDPYTVNINGQDYMMGVDANADGNISDIDEILGLNDTQNNLFGSLKTLDTNNDGYVSQEELQAQNIVLSAVSDGKLTGAGYDMSQVKGINLADLQNADGTDNTFGHFTMDLLDQQVKGKLTFEDGTYFNKLFGNDISEEDIADESATDAIAIPTSIARPTSAATKSASSTTTAEDVTTDAAPVAEEATAEDKTSSIDTSRFSFNFSDADDNKSTIEKLFEQICWKLGITNISSAQKYSIIDGIDPNTDANIAEATITEDLDKFNLSA